MTCEFLHINKSCYLSQKGCKRKEYNSCKFYLRQHPKNKAEYDERFYKTLKTALKKRDIFDKHSNILKEGIPDYSVSIFQNVNKIIQKIESPQCILKKTRNLTQEDLEGDVLINIASNLYNETPITILGKDEKKNYILVAENSNKYIRYIKVPIKDFLNKLKKVRKKAEYIEKQTMERIKL